MEVAAAIFAGGRATRLGGVDKPLVMIDGETILARQLRALEGIADEILIVVDRAGRLPLPAGVREVIDARPGEGPLAALEAALAATECKQLLAFGGDLPALSRAAITLVRDHAPDADACVPLVDGRWQSLHARYARRVLPIVRELLDAGERSLRSLLGLGRIVVAPLEEQPLRAVDPTLLTLAGVNTPEELAHLAARLHALRVQD